MANLLAVLRTTADSLRAYDKALEVTQNNVANTSTPGYARLQVSTVALHFDPDGGATGGIGAGPVVSTRSDFAERVVRHQMESLGRAKTESELLSGIEAAFPINGESGIAGAMNRLLQRFSSWSLTPNDPIARQAVLDDAGALARAFNDTAEQLAEASRLAEVELHNTVSAINSLAATLRECNQEIRTGAMNDVGLDARIHATLEELSELVDFTAVRQGDGTVMVLAGGTVPLVIGDNLYEIALGFDQPEHPAYPGGPLAARVLDSSGADITSRITGGRLAGAIKVRNGVLGSLIGDSNQPGDLNRLAMAFADRVNSLLAAGLTPDGVPPPEPLFQYSLSNDTAAAKTFALNPAFTPDMLAAIEPGPPYTANGTALRLAGLAKPAEPADTIDGQGFMAFYASMASRVGRQSGEARQTALLQTEAVAQARSMRSEVSGVSLDHEAILLMAYQRAYEAAANVISVLNEMTAIAVNILR